jgi:hypothetical protein
VLRRARYYLIKWLAHKDVVILNADFTKMAVQFRPGQHGLVANCNFDN